MAVNGNSRRVLQVDWGQVRNLARIYCTPEEICSVCNISDVRVLERVCKRDQKMTLHQFLSREQRYGNAGIRRAQWQLAVEDRDGPMLRFLGKQLLGQTDEVSVNLPPASGQFGAGAAPAGASSGRPLVQIVIKAPEGEQRGPTAMAMRWYDTPPPEGAPKVADDVIEAEGHTVEPGAPTGPHVPRGTTEPQEQSDEGVEAPPTGGTSDSG